MGDRFITLLMICGAGCKSTDTNLLDGLLGKNIGF